MVARVAIVGGVRTPFVKAGGAFRELSLQDLGAHVLKAAVRRYDLRSVDEFLFSTVLLDPRTPNWAREIVLAAGLPKSIYAHSLSNNCISGLVAVANAADRIQLGRAGTIVCGGSESMSNPSLVFSYRSAKKFMALFAARTAGERAKMLLKFRPKDLLPTPPAVTEPSTGLTMGQHMEITAKALGITRKDQDDLAFKSHQNAAAAEAKLSFEIEPLSGVTRDLIVRKDTTLEKLNSLKPVFDRTPSGTLTAGNSSALTDGASVVVLMSEERAKAEGREILGYIRDYEFSAIDPNAGLLMAPAVAVPRLLKRNRFRLEDFDRLEIHEAFAAQVLANAKAWREGLMEEGVGGVDWSRVNVLGGSIALGHPFAATAGRMILSLVNELKREKMQRGLISICAAGAMGGAMIVERS